LVSPQELYLRILEVIPTLGLDGGVEEWGEADKGV
jgi:hypothetical protein